MINRTVSVAGFHTQHTNRTVSKRSTERKDVPTGLVGRCECKAIEEGRPPVSAAIAVGEL